MVGVGSQVLDRLHQAISQTPDEDDLVNQIQSEWRDLAIAWKSTRADRIVALTRLQEALRRWTATTALVAEDDAVQRYRRKLHLTLDH